MRLSDFRALSFDCYGTLIDWETGIATALQPLAARAAQPISRDAALAAFARHEAHLQSTQPTMLYHDLLAAVHAAVARDWNVPPNAGADQRFAAAIADWPAFPDTVAALHALKRHFRLAILSNVDHRGFRSSAVRLDTRFDLVCTAEDVGSYKPAARNFEFLLAGYRAQGIAPNEILHVAQSLFHDHAPANAAGLASAWIDRRQGAAGWGATSAPPNGVRYDCRFPSLEAFAAAHRREIGASPGG